jgi:hypothetical protein
MKGFLNEMLPYFNEIYGMRQQSLNLVQNQNKQLVI